MVHFIVVAGAVIYLFFMRWYLVLRNMKLEKYRSIIIIVIVVIKAASHSPAVSMHSKSKWQR